MALALQSCGMCCAAVPFHLFCRELFDTETEAARAYDTALWRLKPREARNYANFKDTCPPDVAELLSTLEKVR